jgi:hypothetical protein
MLRLWFQYLDKANRFVKLMSLSAAGEENLSHPRQDLLNHVVSGSMTQDRIP